MGRAGLGICEPVANTVADPCSIPMFILPTFVTDSLVINIQMIKIRVTERWVRDAVRLQPWQASIIGPTAMDYKLIDTTFILPLQL